MELTNEQEGRKEAEVWTQKRIKELERVEQEHSFALQEQAQQSGGALQALSQQLQRVCGAI